MAKIPSLFRSKKAKTVILATFILICAVVIKVTVFKGHEVDENINVVRIQDESKLQEKIEGTQIVKLKTGVTKAELDEFAKSNNIENYKYIEALNSVIIKAEVGSLPDSDLIEKTEPDYYIAVLEENNLPVPNDPLFNDQWALTAINAQKVWADNATNFAQETIAVVDTGVCLNHPDLAGRIVEGWDFVENDNVPQDDFDHGCGVAGIIAANKDNNVGIAGVNPNAMIMPVRVLDANGMGTYSNLAQGIVYAADHDAKVINLSLGGYYDSEILKSAVDYAVGKGITIVAAAGNTGNETVLYPAKYDNVIAVGSVDRPDAEGKYSISSFSSKGNEIDVWAPGRDIYVTTKDGGYALKSGTSFAGPMVTVGLENISLSLSDVGSNKCLISNSESLCQSVNVGINNNLIFVQTVSTKDERPEPFLYWPMDDYYNITNYTDSNWTQATYPGYTYSNHGGTDLGLSHLPVGSEEVYAMASGYIDEVKTDICEDNLNPEQSATVCSDGYGNHVKIRHTTSKGTFYTVYAHLRKGTSSDLHVNDFVEVGTLIGMTGNNGASTGHHLHFEIQREYNAWDDPWGDKDAPYTDPDDGELWVRDTDGKIILAKDMYKKMIPVAYDFNQDGKDDIGVFQSSTGKWIYKSSIDGSVNNPVVNNGVFEGQGTSSDIPFIGKFNSADYTLGIYKLKDASNRWHIYGTDPYGFGDTVDIPLIGKFDIVDGTDLEDDNYTDIALFRSQVSQIPLIDKGEIYVQFNDGSGNFSSSSDIPAFKINNDTSKEIPIVGDFDGDDQDEIGIFRPGSSDFAFKKGLSSDTPIRYSLELPVGEQFKDTDLVLVGDLDNDGKDSLIIFSPDNVTWKVYTDSYGDNDTTLSFYQSPFIFGISGDIPFISDYDGDNKADFGVFRPSDQKFYSLISSNSYDPQQTWSFTFSYDYPNITAPENNSIQQKTFDVVFENRKPDNLPVGSLVEVSVSPTEGIISKCNNFNIDTTQTCHIELDPSKGTEYQIKARFVDSTGNGGKWSSITKVKLPALTLPAKDTIFPLLPSEGSKEITFNWDAYDGATKYDLYVNSNTTYNIKIDELPITLPVTYSGNSISWHVVAKNSNNTVLYVYPAKIFTFNKLAVSLDCYAEKENQILCPVYRYRNKTNGFYVYTSNVDEIIALDSNASWELENLAFYAYNSQVQNSLGVRRFRNNSNDDHVFTLDLDEISTLNNSTNNWTAEPSINSVVNPVFYAFDSSNSNTVPVYRLYNNNQGFHVYTISVDEKNSILSENTDPNNPIWLDEGIAFYAYSPDICKIDGFCQMVRMFNKLDGKHFYSNDLNEIISAKKNDPNWTIEETSFYTYGLDTIPNHTGNLSELFRLRKYTGVYVYTTSEDEKNTLLSIDIPNSNPVQKAWTDETSLTNPTYVFNTMPTSSGSNDNLNKFIDAGAIKQVYRLHKTTNESQEDFIFTTNYDEVTTLTNNGWSPEPQGDFWAFDPANDLFKNNIPVIVSTSAQSLIDTSQDVIVLNSPNSIFTYDVEAIDPENDVITYSLVTKPDGMTIDSQTGLVTWNYTNATVGDYKIKIQTFDGSLSDTQEFTIRKNAAACGSNPSVYVDQAKPVYRYFNIINNNHHYVITDSEKQTLDSNPTTWQYEKIAFYAYDTQVSGSMPVYRFWRTSDNAHFFTLSETEKSSLMSDTAYTYEGISFYMYNNVRDGSLNVYRFRNMIFGNHIYTLDLAEQLTLNSDPDWTNEGVAFYSIDMSYVAPDCPNNPPYKARLISPTNNSDLTDTNVRLSWQAATDPDGEQVHYNIYIGTSLDNLTLVSSNMVNTYYDFVAEKGKIYYWEVISTDSHLATSESVVWKFSVLAHAPIITSKPVTVNAAGSLYRYQVVASDPDFDYITYSLTNAPQGMSIDNSTGLILWDTTGFAAGDYNVHIRSTDSVYSDYQTYNIKIITNSEDDFLWAVQFGAESYDSISMSKIKGDYIYSVGSFSKTVNIDGYEITGAASENVVVIKQDLDGNVIWVKGFTGSDRSKAQDLDIDNNGNIYITGYFYNNLNFENTSLNTVGGIDFFVTKLDSEGNVLWAKSAGSTNTDYSFGLHLDNSDNVFVTGYFYDADLHIENQTVIKKGGEDIFLAKYSTDGVLSWVKSYGSSDGETATSLDFDNSGNIIISGKFYKTIQFGSTTLTAPDYNDIYVVKLDNEGNPIWADNLGIIGYISNTNVKVDEDNNFYVGGTFNTSVQKGSYNFTTNGSLDTVIAKYNSNNSIALIKNYGGTSEDILNVIEIDQNKNVYLGGYTKGSIAFDNWQINTGTANFDIFVINLSEDGTVLWAKSITGPEGNDYISSINVTQSNFIYLSGTAIGTLYFDKIFPATNTGTEMFTAKMKVPNMPPVITSTSSVSRVEEYNEFTYQVQATDPNGTTDFVYNLASAPAGMIVDAQGLIKWTPSGDANIKTHAVTVEVSDGKLKSSQTFNVEVYRNYEYSFITNEYSFEAKSGVKSSSIKVGDNIYLVTGTTILYKIASNGVKIWEKYYNQTQPTSNVSLRSIIDTGDGVIVVGTANENGNNVIFKIDYDGNLLWHKKIKTDISAPRAGGVFSDGSFIVAGSNTNLEVLRFDTNGNIIWSKKVTAVTGMTDETSIVLLDDSSFIIGGSCTTGLSDGYLVKITKDGNVVWSKTIGNSSSYDYLNSVSKSNDGNLLVSGTTITNGQYSKIWFANLDLNATVIWQKQYITSNINSENYSIIQLTNNDLVLAGGTWYQGVHYPWFVKVDANFVPKYEKLIKYGYNINGGVTTQNENLLFYINNSASTATILAQCDFNGNMLKSPPSCAYLTDRVVSQISDNNFIMSNISNTTTDFVTTVGTSSLYSQNSGGATTSYVCGPIQNYPQPPVITSTAIIDANANAEYKYDVEATDANSTNILNYSLEVKPDGMTIDDTTGLIIWTPNDSQVGTQNVKVKVTDGRFSVYQEFTISTIKVAAAYFENAIKVGSNVDHTVEDIAVDDQGNRYVFGSYYGYLQIGNTTLQNRGGYDVFLVKYDTNNNVVWIKTFGNAVNDEAKDIRYYDNNIYFTLKGSSINFDGETISGSMFLAKYDLSGNKVWAKGFSLVYRMTMDGTGSIYLTGGFSGSKNFGGTSLSATATSDTFVAKYDSVGNLVWVKKLGKTGVSGGMNITIDASSNAVIVGRLNGTIQLPDGTILTSNVNSNSYEDFFVAKYSATGDLLWCKLFGGTGMDRATDVVADSTNNIYFTGYIEGAFNIGNIPVDSNGGNPTFVAKLSSTGDVLFAKTYHLISNDPRHSIKVASNGDVYLVGYYDGTFTLNGFTVNNLGGTDSFLMRLNSEGNLVWGKTISGSNSDLVKSIIIKSNDIYLVGQSNSSLVKFDTLEINGSTTPFGFVTKLKEINN